MSAHIMTERVQMALEVTRGTAVAPMTLDVPFVGEGLVPSSVSHLGEVRGSAHFPSRTDMVALGVTHGLSLAVEVNRNNIRDLILLATKRTNGVLPAVTIVHNQHGLGPARYRGCVCERLRLGFSTSGSPDGAAVLAGQMDFQCMHGAEGGGTIAELTAPHAARFRHPSSTLSISGTAVPVVLGVEVVIQNTLALGPPDLDGLRGYIVDGEMNTEIRVSNYFAATTLRTLLEGQTETANNSIVFATGTANETVTGTMGKLRLGTRTRGSSDGAPVQEFTLEPWHTGSAHQIAWTFGSSIGASVLGL